MQVNGFFDYFALVTKRLKNRRDLLIIVLYNPASLRYKACSFSRGLATDSMLEGAIA
jgi:hypothetical protein